MQFVKSMSFIIILIKCVSCAKKTVNTHITFMSRQCFTLSLNSIKTKKKEV